MPYLVMQDGTQIYYEDRGHGEPIVFSHGLTASHRKIQAFVDEFKDQYRCIVYDQRGHGSSDHKGINMNVKTLAQDLHELLEYLELDNVTLVGQSLGAATMFSYVEQYGCERLKRLVNVDMTPCARNSDWKGGLARGEWTDEDFLADMDRFFENSAYGNWIVMRDIMMPALKALPPEAEPGMVLTCKDSCECDPFTSAGLWYSVYRTDSRPALEKITVPFMHIFPETPICSMEAVDYMREHVKGEFVLADGIPGTSHMILMEAPKAVAEQVKAFMNS